MFAISFWCISISASGNKTPLQPRIASKFGSLSSEPFSTLLQALRDEPNSAVSTSKWPASPLISRSAASLGKLLDHIPAPIAESNVGESDSGSCMLIAEPFDAAERKVLRYALIYVCDSQQCFVLVLLIQSAVEAMNVLQMKSLVDCRHMSMFVTLWYKLRNKIY